jgi:hypothetical protein
MSSSEPTSDRSPIRLQRFVGDLVRNEVIRLVRVGDRLELAGDLGDQQSGCVRGTRNPRTEGYEREPEVRGSSHTYVSQQTGHAKRMSRTPTGDMQSE